MEMYNLPEYGSTETYLIQNTDLNIHHPSTSLGQLGAMYPDAAPEYVVEQGLYYPTATNYGYICTGYEPPSDWDGHHRIFGVDSQEGQYVDSQTENFPYIYFAPSYGYTQSPYNPYNPYIPGAMMGVDSSITGSQQFYTIPSYEQQNSSTAYIPMVVQSGPDIISGGATELFLDTRSFTASRSDVPGVKTNFSSTSATLSAIPMKPASNQAHSFVSVAAGPKTNAGPSKLPAAHENIISSTLPSLAPSQTHQGRGAQPVDDILHGKALSHHSNVKMAPSNNLSDLSLRGHGPVSMEKTRPKFQYGSSDGVNGCSDGLIGSNQVKTNRSKSHLAVRAYTTRAGDSDAKGNIIIYTDQYNKDEFPLDHVNAKFFVIKSYSEDDVHKSIKYNVWSSTPNGNKKLQSAYEDTQRVSAGVPGGCPIYLFFSVNASGQFCGVAEMIGPVDFNKDMDFWQQDKWSGSFPVKWHFIKDVPNPCFRHIILENNENKPVTNSRDTQEIRYKQGIEMLKIFKSYSVKTSLLDDFMYYENRQKIMQEEKARLVIKSYGSAFLVPGLDPPRKHSFLVDMPRRKDDETAVVIKNVDHNKTEEQLTNARRYEGNIADEANKHDGDVSSLKIDSLTIDPNQAEVAIDNIVTVGSMPVAVNTCVKSSGFFTVGSISLDPKSLQTNEPGADGK